MSKARDYLQHADYQARAAAESKKWGDHLRVEASGEMNAWLDHPWVLEHYKERGLIEGRQWVQWVVNRLGRPAERSLDLGCGAASRSIGAWEAGATAFPEGVDISAERVAEGERLRLARGMPGQFRVEDINTLELPPSRYDLVFSAHSFHHFLELEHVMEQVSRTLTPEGVFILEEFVGPTQFQWTALQMEITASLLGLIPEDHRKFRWGAVKHREGRPPVEDVVKVSPFESIRSGEITALFERHFDVILVRKLGGTIQHLLYNGIIHNFWPVTEEAARCLSGILAVEDGLIDSGLLPSDFMLLVGQRRR